MTWESCTACGAEIATGEAAWTVNVHHETFDGEEIEVLEARLTHVYCEACARSRDFDQLSVPEKVTA
jgi:hypothetical protein